MNAAKLRQAIETAAANAIQHFPDDCNQRAAYFVSALTGRTSFEDPALSAVIWSVLYPNVPAPTSAAGENA